MFPLLRVNCIVPTVYYIPHDDALMVLLVCFFFREVSHSHEDDVQSDVI